MRSNFRTISTFVAALLLSACASHKYMLDGDAGDASSNSTIIKQANDSLWAIYTITTFTSVDGVPTDHSLAEQKIVVPAGERRLKVLYRRSTIGLLGFEMRAESSVHFEAKAGHIYRVVLEEHQDIVGFWVENVSSGEHVSELFEAPLSKFQVGSLGYF